MPLTSDAAPLGLPIASYTVADSNPQCIMQLAHLLFTPTP